MSLISAFNKNLFDFVDELTEKFPEDENLPYYKNMLLLLKKTNPKQIVLYYKQYIEPYNQYIFSKDESFFLNNDYGEDKGGNQWSLLEGMRMKVLWKEMSDISKNACWEYFNLLSKIALKVN